MSFTPLGSALSGKMSSQTPLKKQVESSLVIEFAQNALNELFGEDQAKHAKPLFLKNRTLTITCSTSSIAQEIRLNQQALVDKINDKLGKKEVDRIRYLA
ncbi:MAG: DUF721 domain-containing protein [Candidatus Magasanikbacteria bacterium]|nr:DUF721 domain-containing protein [Candidatus Magasanikbacteria bacterium]